MTIIGLHIVTQPVTDSTTVPCLVGGTNISDYLQQYHDSSNIKMSLRDSNILNRDPLSHVWYEGVGGSLCDSNDLTKGIRGGASAVYNDSVSADLAVIDPILIGSPF